MPALRLAPAFLALLVLGAHFYRAGSWPALAAVVALIALLPLRLRFVPLLMQVALAVGAVEWLRTLLALVDVRQAMGAPWTRMAAILGAVALATLLAAFVFRTAAVRAYYTPGERPSDATT